MTLINFLSRVHFADGVLEIALSAELERNNLTRPVLVWEKELVSSGFSERVLDGLPFWCEPRFFEIPNRVNRQKNISSLQSLVDESDADVVIGFGSSYALSIANAYHPHSANKRSANKREHTRPIKHTFAIPGIDGVPTLSSTPGSGQGSRFSPIESGIQPSAVIIDVTLMGGESIERKASAVAKAIARCLSAQFSAGFNPPADGIALDGIKRIVQNMTTLITDDSLDMRRELMAASLNGTLAMPITFGLAHELRDLIKITQHSGIDDGALLRLLIIIEAELIERSLSERRSVELRSVLGVPKELQIYRWLMEILEILPLPASLEELGIEVERLDSVVRDVATSNASIVPSAALLLEKMTTLDLSSSKVVC